jgi:hypothetical protein
VAFARSRMSAAGLPLWTHKPPRRAGISASATNRRNDASAAARSFVAISAGMAEAIASAEVAGSGMTCRTSSTASFQDAIAPA